MKQTRKRSSQHTTEESSAPGLPSQHPAGNIGSAVGEELDIFLTSISSLAKSLPLVQVMVQASSTVAEEALEAFIKRHAEATKKEGETIYYKIRSEFSHENERLRSDHERTLRALRIIPESFIVALISQLDAYLGRLLKVLFKARPELLASSQRTLTYAQLSAFASIDEARELLIEREIEDMLRASHQDQFQYLESRFSVPLRKDLPAWKTFIEVTQRRNLFVHCDGRVSSQYLQVCKEHEVDCAGIAVGTKLEVSPKYFQNAYRCIFEIGTKLTHVLWRKVLPLELEYSDGSLIDISFDLNSRKEFALSAVILDFATTTLKKHFDDDRKRILVINRAIAYKGLGQRDRMNASLSEHDWSACALKFKLAVCALRDEHKESADLMRQIGANDKGITKAAYRDWPLFSEFRKTNEFRAAYKEVFGEPPRYEKTKITVVAKTPSPGQEKGMPETPDDRGTGNLKATQIAHEAGRLLPTQGMPPTERSGKEPVADDAAQRKRRLTSARADGGAFKENESDSRAAARSGVEAVEKPRPRTDSRL